MSDIRVYLEYIMSNNSSFYRYFPETAYLVTNIPDNLYFVQIVKKNILL